MKNVKGGTVTSVGEGAEKLEPSSVAGGNVKWGSAVRAKQLGCSTKKLIMELPYDLAIPLRAAHPKEVKTRF